MIVSILETFVWINPEWLITGKGEMRKESVNGPVIGGKEKQKNSNTEDRLLSIIESQQRTIESQQESLKHIISGEKNIAGIV